MREKFITHDEMDMIVESILVKAGMSNTWQGEISRIDIDAIIEFEYGLEIVWDNIDSFDEDGIVLAAIFPKHKRICMNETQKARFNENMGTMNFSKAHELGHWVLHVTDQQEYKWLTFDELDTFYCRSFSKNQSIERQADMFAASILMPKHIICGAIAELKKRGYVNFVDLYKLKDIFEVSISALKARANELNLLYITDKQIYFCKADAAGQKSLF